MGTVVSFDVRDRGRPPDGALDGAVAWLHEVDARFSPWRPDSEISRIGDGTLLERDAHPDVRAILAMCDALAVDSGGGVRRAAAGAPTAGSTRAASSRAGRSQRAADRLAAAGLRDVAINAGGDICARGGATARGPVAGRRPPSRPTPIAWPPS